MSYFAPRFFVGKVYVQKEKDYVDFIYQWGVDHFDYNFHISKNNNLLFNKIGATKIQNYFPRVRMINHYVDLSIFPFSKQTLFETCIGADYPPIIPTRISRKRRLLSRINYIDIEFPEAVYPIRVSIYENPHKRRYNTNPGNVIQIWAQDFDNYQWFLLWDLSWIQLSDFDLKSRLFSPPLKLYNFKTKILRLRSFPLLNIESVMLIGTSRMILPRNPKENLTNVLKNINRMHEYQDDIYNLTENRKNAHLDIVHLQENLFEYCIISKSNLFLDEWNGFGRSRNLSELPVEIILIILKYLDFTSLRCMSYVNKFFNTLTPQSYKCLSMYNVQHRTALEDMRDIFCYFTARCKSIRQLDLTSSKFYVEDFVSFLNYCGKDLTHLRLSKCRSINNFALLNISKICKNLKELTLGHLNFTNNPSNEGFLYLKNLNNLEYLDLTFTHINDQSLSEILRSNQQMRVLNLNYTYITPQGINALADCKNLRKVIFPSLRSLEDRANNFRANGDNFYRVLSSCQRLEEIHFFGIYFNDRCFELLSQCQNLEQLYLHDVGLPSIDIMKKCSVIFERCSSLQKFYFIYLYKRQNLVNLVDIWKEKYPHVSIRLLSDFEPFEEIN